MTCMLLIVAGGSGTFPSTSELQEVQMFEMEGEVEAAGEVGRYNGVPVPHTMSFGPLGWSTTRTFDRKRRATPTRSGLRQTQAFMPSVLPARRSVLRAGGGAGPHVRGLPLYTHARDNGPWLTQATQ